MEKIIICPLFVCLGPYPGPNSILDRLPDLSSLQWRGDPFCSQQWPGSICVDHYCELLRPPNAIQALRPSADQLKPGNRHRMWYISGGLIFPSVTRWPVLLAAMARICMRRPPLLITKAPRLHPGPLSIIYFTLDAGTRSSFSNRSCIVRCRSCCSCPCKKWRSPRRRKSGVDVTASGLR